MLALITEQMADVFRKGRTQDGLTCIVIDKVNILICELYISKLMMMFLNIIISLISSIKIPVSYTHLTLPTNREV